mmetsp:Transcript_7885/g.22566  ORF Transcript_7885/g.22566 Transcript_7885/m.22566 type:complete len:211 (+) Transcript_7885:80-712(+)
MVGCLRAMALKERKTDAPLLSCSLEEEAPLPSVKILEGQGLCRLVRPAPVHPHHEGLEGVPVVEHARAHPEEGQPLELGAALLGLLAVRGVLDLVQGELVVPLQSILPGERDADLQGFLLQLRQESLGAALCVVGLLAVPHLDGREIGHGAVLLQHLHDRPVPAPVPRVVVPRRKLPGVGDALVPPVHPRDLDPHLDLVYGSHHLRAVLP